MDVARANKWWQKAMAKEHLTPITQAKSPKGNRWAIPTHDGSLEPRSGRTRERHRP